MSTIAEPIVLASRGFYPIIWSLLLVVPVILVYWYNHRLADGEPPLISSKIPWLGHGMSFMKDMNGFAEWTR